MMGKRNTYEREGAYLFPQDQADNPARWHTEAGYFPSYFESGDGLGEDAGESTLMVGNAKPWYQSLVETVVPAAMTVYQQQQYNKLNIERARSGLAPVSAAEYSRSYVPTTARVEVAPAAQTQRLLMYGAVGVGLLVALRAFKII